MAKPIRHGTTTAYSHHKCRCDACRAATARYNRDRKAAIRAGTWQPGRPPPPKLEPCIGPECDRLARYSTQPLCAGHLQQFTAGKPLRPLIKKRFRNTDDGTKECSKCERILPLSDFYAQTKSLNRVQSKCKECTAIYSRARKYGISFDEMQVLLAVTACMTCGAELQVAQRHIDHCHDTGRVRGVLCSPCNTALGLLRDDPRVLRALANYVESSR